jgi:predicted permease
MLSDLFAIIAPVFIAAAIGFCWAKSGRPYATDFVTTMSTSIGMPCLVFAAITGLDIAPDALAEMAVAALASLVLFAAIGAAVLALAGLRLVHFLPSLIWNNSGNVGLPLCLFAFGEVGLAMGIAYFAVNSVTQFTIGIWINSGNPSPRILLRSPIVYAVLAASACVAADVTPPAWLLNTTKLLGDVAIPLMLLTLGVSLANLRISALRVSVLLTTVRLLSGLPIGYAIGWTLGLEGAALGVFLIQCAMPIAVTNYLLSLRYGGAATEVAAACVLSTAVSFALLPALLWLVL